MNHFETVATLPDPTETPQDYERLDEVVAVEVGHIATMDEFAGLESLDAYLNGGQPSLERRTVEGGKSRRIHDIEAAHEAALLENEIFDAHVAALRENEIFDAHAEALKENEIFDAHVAALKENEEREAAIAKARELEQEARKDEVAAAQSTPDTPDTLRQEAAVALERAAPNLHLTPRSTVTKDQKGNLVILDGDDAKIVSPTPDGRPKLTEYHYDKDNGIVTINTEQYSILTSPTDYEETSMSNWQSHDEVITLPPAIAKRFGIEKVIAAR